jgi:membrane-associated phospholipid phosphatase
VLNAERSPAVAALLVPLVVFAVLASLVAQGATDAWDRREMNTLADRLAPLPTPVSADAVLFLGLAVGVVVVVGLGIALLVAGKVRHTVFWTLTLSGALVLDPLLKEVFRRPNLHGDAYSFPSGTAMLSMAALAGLFVLARPWWLRGIVLVGGVLSVVAIGLSVVYLRWHYPSDVVAGWCAALIWVALVWFAVGAERPGRGAPQRG